MRKFAILLLPFLLSSCIETVAIASFSGAYYATHNKEVSDTVSDTQINLKVRQLIKKHKNKKDFIDHQTFQGRVLLTGRISKSGDFYALKEKIWKIKGVKELMDETDKTSKKRNYLRDQLIAFQVKSRLILNQQVKALNINVETYDRQVYLLGDVDSKKEVRKAAQIASRVKGVRQVVSFLR